MRSVLAVACMALVGLAGCLGSTDYEALDADVREAARDPLLAAATGKATPSSYNLELLSYHNGVDNTGVPTGQRFNELAVTDTHVYLGRTSQGAGLGMEGTWGGFSIINIEDPSAPYMMGGFNGLGASDLEVNDEQTVAFLSTQRNTVEELAAGLATTQDPSHVLPRGIYLVDIQDKNHPRFDAFVPVPYNGVHTIEYVRHPGNDQEYIIACVYDLYRNTVPSTTLGGADTALPEGAITLTQRVIVFEVVEEPTPASTWNLRPVSTFQLTDQAPEGRMYIPHDTWVEEHPRTGQVLMYVGYWDKGVRVLDFEDPSVLSEIGSFTDFAPSAFDNIHLAKTNPELIDGTHVLVAEPEIPSGDETGQITFIDASDPTDLRRLGHWTQPDPDLAITAFDNSPHNFDVSRGQVALAHNRLGVWIIDVSTQANLESPRTVGFYFPGVGGNETISAMWGAVWSEHPDHGRLVIASDAATGLHILRYSGPRA